MEGEKTKTLINGRMIKGDIFVCGSSFAKNVQLKKRCEVKLSNGRAEIRGGSTE